MLDLILSFFRVFLSRVLNESFSMYLTSLGGLVSELSGVYLISLEGIMLLAGTVAFIVLAITGSFVLSFLAAIGVGLTLGAIVAVFSVTLRLNQIVLSIGVIMFGVAFSSYIAQAALGEATLSRASFGSLPRYSIPFLSEIPVLKEFFKQTVIGYVVYALVPLSWFILFKTEIGLKVRAVGQHPRSSDFLGLNVTRIRFLAVMIGSLLGSLGGFFLLFGLPPASWTMNFTNGRGIIALAMIRMGSWRPQYVFLASLSYGILAGVAYYLQAGGNLPTQFLLMIPYAGGIIILGLSHKVTIATMPRALGKPYSRTE